MILTWIWTFIYFMVLPSIGAHLVIIYSVFRFKRFNRPVNYFLAYLSICAIFRQISGGLYLADLYFVIFETSIDCAARAIILRLPIIIIVFTMVKLVRERSRITANPNYNPSQGKVIKDILVITFTAFLILIPLGLNKVYDGNLQKCTQVILFGSVPMDFGYRFIYFLTINVIPSVLLFLELIKMVKLLNSWKLEDDPGRDAYSRYKFMRASCLFVFFCVIILLPGGLIDATETPALNMSTTMKWIQKRTQDVTNILYLAGFRTTHMKRQFSKLCNCSLPKGGPSDDLGPTGGFQAM